MKLKKKEIMTYVLTAIFCIAGWISVEVAGKTYKPAPTTLKSTVTTEATTEATTTELITSFTEPPHWDDVKPKYWGQTETQPTPPPNAVRICEYLPMLPEDGGGEVYFDPELQRYMLKLAEENNLPYEFVLAICYVETRFDPSLNNAGLNTNGTTDWGLMQLNDAYIGAFCELYNDGVPVDMLNAYDNAKIGINVLGDINSRQPTLYDVACSYNMGESGWNEYKNTVANSWHYGDKVLEYYAYIRQYFRDIAIAESQR